MDTRKGLHDDPQFIQYNITLKSFLTPPPLLRALFLSPNLQPLLVLPIFLPLKNSFLSVG